MKTAQQIIEEQQGLSKSRDLNQDGIVTKEEDRIYMLKLASQLLQFLRNETLAVEEVNPKDYDNALKAIEKAVIASKTTSVSITNQKDYDSKLDAVLLALKGIKFPEINYPEIPDSSKDLKNIEKAVKAIKIPEVKIPEQKPVDFSVLIKEVKSLGKSLDGALVGKEDKTQEMVVVVLNKLEKGLLNIESGINKLDKEPVEQKDRTDEVLKGLKEVSKTINDIKFPVATFNSQGIIDAVNGISISTGDLNIDTSSLAQEETLTHIAGEFDSVAATLGNIDTSTSTASTKLDDTNTYLQRLNEKTDKGLAKPTHVEYTWTDGYLTQKVATYVYENGGETHTIDYTWEDGVLVDKVLTIV